MTIWNALAAGWALFNLTLAAVSGAKLAAGGNFEHVAALAVFSIIFGLCLRGAIPQ